MNPKFRFAAGTILCALMIILTVTAYQLKTKRIYYYKISGKVGSIQKIDGMNFDLTDGDAFEAFLVIDGQKADSTADSKVGTFTHSAPNRKFGIRFVAKNIEFATDPNSQMNVNVRNDFLDSVDQFSVNSLRTLTNLAGDEFKASMVLNLQTKSGNLNVFKDDSLPTSLSMNDFDPMSSFIDISLVGDQRSIVSFRSRIEKIEKIYPGQMNKIRQQNLRNGIAAEIKDDL